MMGQERYPATDRLMITADGGGSNGNRVRLWKVKLQELADTTGLTLVVCHYPPGTSKWNKKDAPQVCHITQNWRGRPLTSRLAIVELIAATTTKTGLTVRCELDTNAYSKGIKVSDPKWPISTSKATHSIQNGITQSRLADPKPQRDAFISRCCLSIGLRSRLQFGLAGIGFHSGVPSVFAMPRFRESPDTCCPTHDHSSRHYIRHGAQAGSCAMIMMLIHSALSTNAMTPATASPCQRPCICLLSSSGTLPLDPRGDFGQKFFEVFGSINRPIWHLSGTSFLTIFSFGVPSFSSAAEHLRRGRYVVALAGHQESWTDDVAKPDLAAERGENVPL